MDLLLEAACEWRYLHLEAFVGPKRQISMYNQFFHFIARGGQTMKIKE
jgi:hypothetical protein